MAAKISSTAKKRLFNTLIARDGDYCHYCEIALDDVTRSIDHKIPKNDGGVNAQENLVLSCKWCNSQKGSQFSYEEFVELRSRISKPGRLKGHPFKNLRLDIVAEDPVAYPLRDGGA